MGLRPSRLLTALALAVAMLPAATAHTTYYSDDDQYRIVSGQLDEPVYTFAKSGLDLCFSRNTTAREPVAANPGALTATLVSPDGEELTMPLRAQFGHPGCFQFQEGYFLTKPGQYTVNLTGDLNGTQVDLRGMLAGGAVDAMEELTFPDTAVPSPTRLQDENAALRAEVQALAARVQDLEEQAEANGDEDGRGAPGPAVPLALAALAVLAVLRRRSG